MEFRDLKTQYRRMKTDIDSAINRVITNTNFISGKEVGELEEQLAEYVGVKHCITCGNGTDALKLALMAWNIGNNDAVFVPDFTFFSSGECVAQVGATPIFVDIEKNTYNMDSKSLERAIQNVILEGKYKPKVIIAVDLFGLPADMPKISEIAQKYSLLVLEDGAQGFGGRIGMKKACSFGDIATTSFFPAKPLGCYGDGGAIFTDNDEWSELLKSYRVHGKGKDKYDNVRIGMNSRLDTLQAAVLLVKLKAFQKYELKNVNRVADAYTKGLSDVVETPCIEGDFYSSWAQYTIQFENCDMRNRVQEKLKERGIPSMIYYSKPMHMQSAFQDYDCVKTDLSVTSKVCNCVLSIPMHPYLDANSQNSIIEIIRRNA